MAQVTGKVSSKLYKCTECGHTEQQSTNHYGQIYIRCRKCSWKSPMSPIKVYECQEPLPEGWEPPANWNIVKLGDVAEIIQGKPLK